MAVDAQKILNGILSMGLRGDPDTGLLRRYGVIMALNMVDYLVDRELEFLEKHPEALAMMEASLVDAAQWCAIPVFGGMKDSKDWASLCAPMIENVRDHLEALHGVQNAMGWGRIVDYQFDADKRTYRTVVKHSYYVDRYLQRYGKSSRPRCYLWTGVAAGTMDFLLGGKVHDFVGTEVQCATMGHDACVFEVKPAPKMFDLL